MENININWDNPEERANLLDEIGVYAYNTVFSRHIEQSTFVIVSGHSIRQIGSPFGKLWLVGNTGRAFSTPEEAETYARVNPNNNQKEESADISRITALPVERLIVEGEDCPFGGDTTNDCADCVYAIDYMFKESECVRREDE